VRLGVRCPLALRKPRRILRLCWNALDTNGARRGSHCQCRLTAASCTRVPSHALTCAREVAFWETPTTPVLAHRGKAGDLEPRWQRLVYRRRGSGAGLSNGAHRSAPTLMSRRASRSYLAVCFPRDAAEAAKRCSGALERPLNGRASRGGLPSPWQRRFRATTLRPVTDDHRARASPVESLTGASRLRRSIWATRLRFDIAILESRLSHLVVGLDWTCP